MQRNIVKSKNKIKKINRGEISLTILSYIKSNTSIPFIYRQTSMLLLSKLHKNNNFSRIARFCVISGRSRFILKNLNFSRMFLKELISTGFLSGFYKSS